MGNAGARIRHASPIPAAGLVINAIFIGNIEFVHLPIIGTFNFIIVPLRSRCLRIGGALQANCPAAVLLQLFRAPDYRGPRHPCGFAGQFSAPISQEPGD
ncbi:MAG: hypothetical protein LBU32_13095 [Clostridiales bacterium]|nr:hypothetical protein [Clostridiales bacterium]